MRNLLAAAPVMTCLLAPIAAGAHPHVFVDAKAEIVYDGANRIAAIRHVWIFDDTFSAFAVQGLDADNDKSYSREELQPLAEVNVTSLHEFRFFTALKTKGRTAEFDAPKDYWLDHDGSRLTLNYTLPLKQPLAQGREPVVLEVHDPEFFVSFTLVEDAPVRLAGARAACAVAIERPKELDAGTAATLSQIPADVRNLPPELSAITSALANRIIVTCG